jgi:hypothetical protein
MPEQNLDERRAGDALRPFDKLTAQGDKAGDQGDGMNTLDMRLIARGAPAEALTEARGLLRTGGAGMVDLLIQKKVLPEPELLAALGEEYGIPFWEALPTDRIDTGFTACRSGRWSSRPRRRSRPPSTSPTT